MNATGRAAAPDAAGSLLELHRGGRLAARYPDLAALLATAPDDELLHAGRLLTRLDPEEVLRAHPGLPAVSVAVTGHGTLSALLPALAGQFARHGLVLRPHVCDFDSWIFELSDPGSGLYAADPDLTLCVLDPEVVWDEVPAPWRVPDVERVLEEKLALLERLVETFAGAGRGTLVLNTLPLPRVRAAELVDLRSRARLGAVWRTANARLLGLMERHQRLVVLDLDPVLAEGTPAGDARLSAYAKAHLSAALLAEYAREAGHLARHLAGRTKKCLVLDLDETVWGGVLGEVGADGIEVADGPRGEAFRAFQRTARQLASQGVLLAAVSKNDPGPVRAVLRDHPRMTLREGDFVRVIANWAPKHGNLAELAADLNLSTESLVFADDSPFECGLVRRELPEVAVVELDREPALHGRRLLRDGWFTVGELTGEDERRPQRYRDDLERRDFLHSFASTEEYLRGLDVRVRLAEVAETDLGRVSQLTLRTNQFNLTTVRMQPAEVRAFAADPAASALAIHAADRFGENGLVGAVFLRREGAALRLENFLLSCRVFSRGIEQACLAAVLRHARATGAAEAIGVYRPSAKNGKVRAFYPRAGFAPLPDGDGGELLFRHDLADLPEPPGHVRLTGSLPTGSPTTEGPPIESLGRTEP
jgi:FkbH-like protein